MIKLIAPKGVTGVTWRGSAMEVAADGSLQVPDAALEILLAQGFRLAETTATDSTVPPVVRLVSIGFGYYDVLDADGRKLNAKRLKRADAEALAADAAKDARSA